MMKVNKRHILAVMLPFGLAACGGGGSSTPTASGPAVPIASTPDNTVVVRVGPITGFGSVFVDGERFETSSSDTNYLTDDNPADEDDLEIGMIVRVRASSTNDDGEWIADDVEFDENLKGPVDSVAAESFVALGQTINVTAQTYFDDGLSLSDLAILMICLSFKLISATACSLLSRYVFWEYFLE